MRQSLLRKLAYKTSTFVVLTLLILSGLSLNYGLSHALTSPVANPANLSISTPTNCDNNAVLYCGATSLDTLINKYTNGDNVNSAASIQHIYKYFNISASDIKDMEDASSNETVQVGTVSKNGDVYDSSGKVIATSALTAGRIGTPSEAESYGGTTFYVRAPSVSFLSNTLSAYVVTVNNKFSFAILASCGNPVTATPVAAPAPKPAPAPAPTPKPVTPTPAPTPAPTQNTVSYCNGNTVNEDVAGVASQGGNCSQNTTIVQEETEQSAPTPFGQCTSLSLNVTQNSPLMISVTANPTTGNGAQFDSVVFNYGDGTITSPSSQTTATHAYANPGNYTIIATLSFSSSSASVPNATCEAQLSSTAPPPVVTAVAVTPTPTPAPPAQTAAALVNTGPGDVVAVFATASLLGMIGYRMLLSRHFTKF
jgi:hypothetical protein